MISSRALHNSWVPKRRESGPKRRGITTSRGRIFLAVSAVAGSWTVGFLLAAKNFSPPPTGPDPKSIVVDHLSKLAKKQRQLLDLEPYYNDSREAGKVEVVLRFTAQDSIPIRAPAIDGFITRHVDIARGESGAASVLAVFSRPKPYIWPRVLDVSLGPKKTIRADLDEAQSTAEACVYRIGGQVQFEMKSPNGHFTWTTSKDDVLLNSSDCLFRQDLYKDGEYVKSLAAVATNGVAQGPVSNPKILK